MTLGSWTGIWIYTLTSKNIVYWNLKNEKHQIPNCVDFVCALIYRVFIKYCAFSQEFSKNLPPLPRQHSAAIGCTNNYHPIGVTVHSQCVDCTLAMRWELWRSLTVMKAREGLQELWKNTIFCEHPVVVFTELATLLPAAGDPPVIEKAIDGELAEIKIKVLGFLIF